MTTTNLLLAFLLSLAGCIDTAGTNDSPDDDQPEIEVVARGMSGVPSSTCSTSGGSTWCQDYYSARWCTDFKTVSAYGAWDYTGCTWTGYSSEYSYGGVSAYCDRGWLTYLAHIHCP